MFMFSEDVRYTLPHFHFIFFDRYEIHIQYFEILLNETASFIGARLFGNVLLGFQTFDIYKIHNFEKVPVFFS